MVINADVWLSVEYGEKNEFNAEAKEIIMKGLSKPDADKVSHYEITK